MGINYCKSISISSILIHQVRKKFWFSYSGFPNHIEVTNTIGREDPDGISDPSIVRDTKWSDALSISWHRNRDVIRRRESLRIDAEEFWLCLGIGWKMKNCTNLIGGEDIGWMILLQDGVEIPSFGQCTRLKEEMIVGKVFVAVKILREEFWKTVPLRWTLLEETDAYLEDFMVHLVFEIFMWLMLPVFLDFWIPEVFIELEDLL